MARKTAVAVAEPDHDISLSKYQSKLFNITFVEARCSCGWYLRGWDEYHAEWLGRNHQAEPDVLYPSVIFAIKDAENQ